MAIYIFGMYFLGDINNLQAVNFYEVRFFHDDVSNNIIIVNIFFYHEIIP